MISEANKLAQRRWMSNPNNREKHREWDRINYYNKRAKRYEKYADRILAIGDNREALLNYLLDNFNLKVRG